MKSKDKKTPSGSPKKGFSRRGFLRGAGLTTAGTVMLSQGVSALGVSQTPELGTRFPAEGVEIQMKINGRQYALTVEPRTTVATALREHLGFTGTKVVCDHGSCSACTVFIDGKPVNSCITMALDVGASEVSTIEGVSEGDELHPVQEAFIEHDATQCGYCTPGMVMSCVHLLKHNKKPTLKEVKEATRGNLCRCGTHPHVFKATLDAAEKMK